MKKIIKSLLQKSGYKISRIDKDVYPIDYTKKFIEDYQFVEPYTMTSIERIFALKTAIQYTVKNNLNEF